MNPASAVRSLAIQVVGGTGYTGAKIIYGEVTWLSPFLIAEANLAPAVTRITLPAAPIAVGSTAAASASFTDDNPGDTHTATIDWESVTKQGTVNQQAKSVSGSHIYTLPGVYTIQVAVKDGELSSSRSSALDNPGYVVVYDPSAGFVTGGGWFDSPAHACVAFCGGATGTGELRLRQPVPEGSEHSRREH